MAWLCQLEDEDDSSLAGILDAFQSLDGVIDILASNVHHRWQVSRNICMCADIRPAWKGLLSLQSTLIGMNALNSSKHPTQQGQGD